ncbi:MAG: hypothetical protein MPJ25_11195 [Pirellulales bacterium]|nr:hypothetical protein [Pirellulales bacterium]
MANITPKKQHELLVEVMTAVDVEDNEIIYDFQSDNLSAKINCQSTGKLKGSVTWRCSDSTCKIYVTRKFGGSPLRRSVMPSLTEKKFKDGLKTVFTEMNEMLNRDFE